MSNNIAGGFLAAVGFAMVASLTWFFSSRPRLFIRIFVPRDNLRDAVRGFLREPNSRRGMRTIAMLQFGVAILILLGAFVAWMLNW
jgi:hypothetical protein